MKMQRLVWADVLKGILITLVVLGHAMQHTLGEMCFENHLWNIIYSFHMPAFMAVSGFFAYRKNWTVKGVNSLLAAIFRRFRQLVIPFILWTIISLLINSHLNWSSLWNVFLYPDSGLWFLWVLFIISVLFTICTWLSLKCGIDNIYLSVGLGIVLVAVMIVCDIRVFGYQFIAYYYLFYLVGFVLHKYKDTIIISAKPVLALLFACWAFLAWNWNMHSLPVFMQDIPLPVTLVQYGYRFITAVIFIYVAFSVSPYLFKETSRWIAPFVHLGAVSLGIYAVHFILISGLVIFLKSFVFCNGATIIGSFILGIMISWGIVWLLSKWTVTNKFLLGKV